MKKLSVGVVSLGCSKNRVDSEIMMANILKAGHTITADPAEADIVIVNTCGFIEAAKTEAIETILEMSDVLKSRGGKLIVTGCLAKRYKHELLNEMPEIDGLMGVYDYGNVAEVIESVYSGKRAVEVGGDPCYLNSSERYLTTPSHYAYLKIAEGCSNRCSYCAIPSIRGKYVSRDLGSLIREAEILARGGVKELIVIAQDTSLYGVDLGMKNGLVTLLDRLSKVNGIQMIRVLYAYPESVDEDFFRFISGNEKICNYLDLPIQHISDRVLNLMHRRGGSECIIRATECAAKYGISLRTSLIAGFPTETEEEFSHLKNFITEFPFEHLGVFAFSAEEGTPASEMEDYPAELKERRREILCSLQAEISARIKAKRVGQTLSVIIDELDETGFYIGRSQYEAPETDGVIYVSSADALNPGDIVSVKITQSSEYDLMGEVQ